MPSRPYWKGFLKLSLVSCPIAAHAATSTSERVKFNQVNRATGNRLRQQLIDEDTGDVVDGSEKARGYAVGRFDYMLVEDEELDAIAIESTHTLEIDRFVPRAEIDERFLDNPYYIAPEGKVAQDAFAVIRDAMRGKDMVALGRIVLAKRERVVMLQAWDKGMLATTLRYASEVRDARQYFDGIPDVPVPPDMLRLAEHILETKAAHFVPDEFHDRYEEAVIAMLKAKQAGHRPRTGPSPVEAPRVVDLMEALKRSLAGAGRPNAKPRDVLKPVLAKNKSKKRIEGQREMLLPIAGKGPVRAIGRTESRPGSGRKTG